MYQKKSIKLNGNRRLINACKKAGLDCYNPQGEWNGFGYTRLPMEVMIHSISDMRKYNNILRDIDSDHVRKVTEEEKEERWCKRLSKLTGITLEEAKKIAANKKDAKIKEIDNLEERQCKDYSSEREKLITKIRRSNPLRYIENEEHAHKIINAHNRHSNTAYDSYLEEIHQMEAEGEILRGHAKERAHLMLQGKFDDAVKYDI